MQCGNCGHELTTGAGFCGNCGAQIAQIQPPPAYSAPIPQGPQRPAGPVPPPNPQRPPAPTSPLNQPPLPPPLQNQQPYYQGTPPVQLHPSSRYNEMSIIAIVLILFFPPVSLILGIIALNQIKRTHERGRGLAIASIIIGGIVIAFFVLMLGFIASVPYDEID